MIYPEQRLLDYPPENPKELEKRRKLSLALGGSGVVVTPQMAASIYLDTRKQSEIAREHNINPTHVSLIKKEKTWVEITGPLKQRLQAGEDITVLQGMIKEHGQQPRAKVICDYCAAEDFFNCDYERPKGGGNDWIPNVGQIIQKMNAKGWADVKGKHRCPTCEAARKAKIVDPTPKKANGNKPAPERKPGKLRLNFGAPQPKQRQQTPAPMPVIDLGSTEQPSFLDTTPFYDPQPNPSETPADHVSAVETVSRLSDHSGADDFTLGIQEAASAPSSAMPVIFVPKPSRERKREIVQMLMVAYDTVRGRYSENESDKTVAEAIGPDVLTEWVAELREDMFGPASNPSDTPETILQEQINAFRHEHQQKMSEMLQHQIAAKVQLDQCQAALITLTGQITLLHSEFETRLDEMQKRLRAIKGE